MSIKENLLKKIDSKSSVVGIIGMGYVGIPLFLRFAFENFSVIGFDIDEEKIKQINSGKSYFKHIPGSSIKKAIDKYATSTTNFSKISDCDVIILCLPTPLNKDNTPNLDYVLNSLDSIIPFLKEGQLLSLESTTYPGTTEEEILPRLEDEGFEVGRNFFLAYSPEREDPGNLNFNPKNIPKIVSGYSKVCLEIANKLYGSVVDNTVPLSSLKTAEMTKLLENIYRAVNIGLINEMKIVSDALGIDIHEVIQGASTKPFGFKPFFPGPGLGGHCIPIDPFYLTWKAKQIGIDTRFIELAGEVNTNMPNWVVTKVEQSLKKNKIEISQSKILILGLAYKKNIDDVRESPAVELLSLLSKKAKKVDYSDPFINKFPKMRNYDFSKESIDLNRDNIKKYDLVLIATDHDEFDYEFIKKNANIIVDTRGIYKDRSHNIVKA